MNITLSRSAEPGERRTTIYRLLLMTEYTVEELQALGDTGGEYQIAIELSGLDGIYGYRQHNVPSPAVSTIRFGQLRHYTFESFNVGKIDALEKSIRDQLPHVERQLLRFIDQHRIPKPPAVTITLEDRGEHTAIVAGAGHGKTQLLLSIIAEDLQRPDPPGMVIIDPTGGITNAVQRLAIFSSKLHDRLIILDPEMEPAPALNIFALPLERLARYPRRQQQGLENDIVDLFSYVFASADTPLTGLQQGPFAYLIRLMLTIPGSTLFTLKELLEDKPLMPPKGGG